MKTITHNLTKFAITATILTILFRYSLTYGIENNTNFIIFLSALLYALAMFVSGWTFGKKDREYLPIYDVGFRFHLATYLIHNILSELWFVRGFNSKNENITVIHSTAIIWGIFLIIHFLIFFWTRKNSINNLDKEDLFD